MRINDFPSAFEDEDYLRYVDNVISKNKFDLIIFSDFNYGSITPNIYARIMDRIKTRDPVIVADSQSSSQVGKIEIFKEVNLICMTEYEARLALKEYTAPLNRLADMVLNKFDRISYCILKLGEHGMIVSKRNENNTYTQEHIHALNTDPIDTSGAGDALLVGTSIGLAHKLSIFESAYLGAMFAAIQCSRRGNVAVKPEEVIKFLR